MVTWKVSGEPNSGADPGILKRGAYLPPPLHANAEAAGKMQRGKMKIRVPNRCQKRSVFLASGTKIQGLIVS